jgi:hypothetical protein
MPFNVFNVQDYQEKGDLTIEVVRVRPSKKSRMRELERSYFSYDIKRKEVIHEECVN